mgnify:CR=1 FL=1
MLMESYPIFKQIFRKVGEERLKLSRNMVRRKGVVRTTDKRKTFSESHADLLDIDRIASGGAPGQRPSGERCFTVRNWPRQQRCS